MTDNDIIKLLNKMEQNHKNHNIALVTLMKRTESLRVAVADLIEKEKVNETRRQNSRPQEATS